MQHKQDNEWDNLFRNKFDIAEITPSANIWANIEAELAPKKRRLIPIYWWAAASVVVVCTTLLVFVKTDKSNINEIKNMATVSFKNKPVKSSNKTDAHIALKSDNKKQAADLVASTKKLKENPKIIIKNIADKIEEEKEALNPNLQINYKSTKQVEIKVIDTILIANVLPQKNAVVVVETDTTSITKNTLVQTNNTPKKGIKNVGDLVNFLVSKIDKREKKLVKFNTDEEGNSSITAINIGFIQLNSKKSYNN
ncbi:MAG: hypothetical protein EAZ15_04945 [Sphingobacteriales bacterium]|nr:MAG: hypothetical protein EAZ15_04945 [Sphingobacteriales bacterium]